MKRVEGAVVDIGCDCRGYDLHYIGTVRRSPTGRALMVEWVER